MRVLVLLCLGPFSSVSSETGTMPPRIRGSGANTKQSGALYRRGLGAPGVGIGFGDESGGDVDGLEEVEEEEEIVPSMLHKYSAAMRETQFSYDAGEDEPLVHASFFGAV